MDEARATLMDGRQTSEAPVGERRSRAWERRPWARRGPSRFLFHKHRGCFFLLFSERARRPKAWDRFLQRTGEAVWEPRDVHASSHQLSYH